MQISVRNDVLATFTVNDAQTLDRGLEPAASPIAGAMLRSLDNERVAQYLHWAQPQRTGSDSAETQPPRSSTAADDGRERYEIVYVDTADPHGDSRATIWVDDTLTMVCEFDVADNSQQDLLQLLRRDHEEFLHATPGFVSVSFHRGLRFGKVLEYLQFQSAEQFQDVSRTEQGKRHLAAIDELASSNVGLYHVESVFPPSPLATLM